MATADRAFELTDAVAEGAAKLRQPFRAENEKGDDENDSDLEGSDVSWHLVMVTVRERNRISICAEPAYPEVGFCLAFR